MKHHFSLTEAQSQEQFQRTSKDLLQHDPARGINVWSGFDHPTMLVWAGRIFDFLRVQEEVSGFYPARRNSYLVGYKSGWDGAEVNSAFYQDAPAEEARLRLLEAGAGILAGAGWGRCTIDYDDEAGSVRWDFPTGTAVGLAAKLAGPRSRPACSFVAGYVAGWTNRTLGMEIEIEERECVASESSRCAFESVAFMRPKAEFVKE